MGLRDLQEFLEADCQAACKAVDLLKMARTYQAKRKGKNSGRLRLVVDAESCLDRLYGGFYSDWACGGQWNRMTNFLSVLIQACHSANMELVVFFNGAAETERLTTEWAEQMMADKKKVASVLKHIHHKATPPPKVWWVPPVCLRQCLRMVLRQLGVAVACSMDDHHQEVIAYCRENAFQGIVAQDADFAIFDPPRYFSSHSLKLTYRQALETKEYVMEEVAKHWDLHPKRFTILAALLGNHILTEKDLTFFFESLSITANKPSSERIKSVLEYVRALKSEDVDEIVKDVFSAERVGDMKQNMMTELENKFKKSIQYYTNGTQEGFLNYKPKASQAKQPGSYPAKSTREKTGKDKDKTEENSNKDKTESIEKDEKTDGEEQEDLIVNGDGEKHEEDEEDEKEEHDEEVKNLNADSVYIERDSGYANPDASAPEIVIDAPNSDNNELSDGMKSLLLDDHESEEAMEDEEEEGTKEEDKVVTEEDTRKVENDEVGEAKKDCDETAKEKEGTAKFDEETANDIEQRTESKPGIKEEGIGEQGTKSDDKDTSLTTNKKAPAKDSNKKPTQKTKATKPQVPPEITRIASERHQKGLMTPWVYQVLSQGEIKLDVTMEDETNREFPTAVELFRSIRACVYAVLFDVNRRRITNNKTNNNPNVANKEVIIKEWTLPRGSSVPRVDQVRARPLDWKVPTVRRLWLGQAIEDKNRRLRALLSCLRSDTPRMLNTSYVPQHLLIMACVLRYMILHKDVRVLRKHELDAFLCAAVSPLLHDVETMQEMKLPMITSRGVQLAALFMRGVEAAIFANDACGAPIPWSMCGPWHFFDGKLFHFKLLKANNNTALLDICDGHMEQMMRVERLRSAILDGIPPETLFARPALPVMQQPQYGGTFFHPSNNISFRPAGAPGMMTGGMGDPMQRGGRGRGLLGRSPVDSRGGQLQIAGVVVGNWGANVQANQARPGHRASNVAPPHITAVGPRRGGMGAGGTMRGRGLNGVARGGFAAGIAQRPGSAGRGYNNRGQPGMQRSNFTAVKSGIRASTSQMRMGSAGNNAAGMRGKSRIRGPAGYNPGNKVVVEQRPKYTVAGRGRGMTIENPMDSNNVVSINQLMKTTAHAEKGQGNDRDFGQFMDVEPVKHAEVKVNLDDDIGLGDESTL